MSDQLEAAVSALDKVIQGLDAHVEHTPPDEPLDLTVIAIALRGTAAATNHLIGAVQALERKESR